MWKVGTLCLKLCHDWPQVRLRAESSQDELPTGHIKCYENLLAAGSINTPLTELELELEAANRSNMKIYGMCNFELIVHRLVINMDTVLST